MNVTASLLPGFTGKDEGTDRGRLLPVKTCQTGVVTSACSVRQKLCSIQYAQSMSRSGSMIEI
ncbi:hypothetical protein ACP90_12890 [Labrenzia sp. CP4]|nr:hypothetical protein ACP90_12890 [Labrenzia sp. CP4]